MLLWPFSEDEFGDFPSTFPWQEVAELQWNSETLRSYLSLSEATRGAFGVG